MSLLSNGMRLKEVFHNFFASHNRTEDADSTVKAAVTKASGFHSNLEGSVFVPCKEDRHRHYKC
jgi:hypothetical protein